MNLRVQTLLASILRNGGIASATELNECFTIYQELTFGGVKSVIRRKKAEEP